ncbi:sulfatase-like hydrolase/transferase [Shigella flexneri]
MKSCSTGWEVINNLKGDGVIVVQPSAATVRPITTTILRRSRNLRQPAIPTKSDLFTATVGPYLRNTILYVDYIVDKAINILKERQDNFTTGLVYLSDHGES